MLGECLKDDGGTPARAVVASRFIQGHDGPCDVFGRVGRGVRGACGPSLPPGGIGGIRARPPLVEPTFRAGEVPTEVLDLVVGKRVVEGQGPTVGSTLGPRRSLCKLRGSCAAFVLRSAGVVLDVLAHIL